MAHKHKFISLFPLHMPEDPSPQQTLRVEHDRAAAIITLDQASREGWEVVSVVPAGDDWLALLRQPVSHSVDFDKLEHTDVV